MSKNNRTIVDCLIALAVAAMVAAIAGSAEPQFSVVNKCDCPQISATKFTVVNKIPARSYVEGTKKVFAFRSPKGHTHTCVNGHTWDHEANPTHKCQFCGASQFVQDSRPRMVTTEKLVQTKTLAPAQGQTTNYRYDHASAQTANFSSVYSIPGVSAGGCANGQCGMPQTAKFRLLR